MSTARAIIDAAIIAAELRLRPILMTSIAFILGVTAALLRDWSWSVWPAFGGAPQIVGGMILSTVLNLVFIPVLYVILKTVLGAFSGKPKTDSRKGTSTSNHGVRV